MGIPNQFVVMTSNLKAPSPIFDTLDSMENPYRTLSFDVRGFVSSKELASEASVDYEYALKFLYSYNGSTATFNAYRRELERFLHWSWTVCGLSVLFLKREDIEEFVQFCQAPSMSWIGVKTVTRFVLKDGVRVANPDWRPFVVTVTKDQKRRGLSPDPKDYELSQSAMKSLFTALSSFYDFMCQEGITEINPVSLIRQKSKYFRRSQTKSIVRRISNLQWEFVIETAEIMANENPEMHERTLFIMSCLYSMYLRISELVEDELSSPVMGDFKKNHDGNWFLHVVGKGNKHRTVTVSDAMLNALKRYRRHLGLSPLPAPNDKTPLIPKNLGKGSMTSTRHIRSIVQSCFDYAYERMRVSELEDEAADLLAATVHWLRHTGISEDVKHRPREHVRDDAGHQTMHTTDRYIDSDERERHRSGKGKRIKEGTDKSV